jgi:hypothetical protein
MQKTTRQRPLFPNPERIAPTPQGQRFLNQLLGMFLA